MTLKRYSSEDIQMAIKYVESCSISVTRETTTRYHLTPAIIIRRTSAGEGAEKLEPEGIAAATATRVSRRGRQLVDPPEVEPRDIT